MLTLIITILIIIVAVFSMAIGVLFNYKELTGSCGGEDKDCTCNKIQQNICRLKLNLTES